VNLPCIVDRKDLQARFRYRHGGEEEGPRNLGARGSSTCLDLSLALVRL
jgi:hypothetical protein